MRRTLIALMMIPFLACAISGGPLDPEGDPTPSGAETTPPPDPIAGTIAREPEALDTGDLSRVRQTMTTIESLGARLARYHEVHGRYPDAHSTRELAAILGERDDFIDGWGRPLRYELRNDGRSYVLASMGADGDVVTSEWETAATLSNPAHDIVYRDGRWIRSWPR